MARYIADRVLDTELAAWLWLLIEAGASTIVCAGPSGAGKSTLLTSLLGFLDTRREPYFVRGRYEQFGSPAPLDACALLINEISPHLPVYLWGPGLGRAHELARQGAQLMATAHADTSGELIDQLAAFPNDLLETDLACWDLAIFLDAWIEERTIRREVRTVESLLVDADGRLAIERLAARSGRRAPLVLSNEALRRLVARLGLEPIGIEQVVARRAELLHAELTD